MSNVVLNGGVLVALAMIVFEVMNYVGDLATSGKHCRMFVRVIIFVAMTASLSIGYMGGTMKAQAEELGDRDILLSSTYNMEKTNTN